jgi:hypothetical protein
MTKLAESGAGSESGSIKSEARIRGAGSVPKCPDSAALLLCLQSLIPPQVNGRDRQEKRESCVHKIELLLRQREQDST